MLTFKFIFLHKMCVSIFLISPSFHHFRNLVHLLFSLLSIFLWFFSIFSCSSLIRLFNSLFSLLSNFLFSQILPSFFNSIVPLLLSQTLFSFPYNFLFSPFLSFHLFSSIQIFYYLYLISSSL